MGCEIERKFLVDLTRWQQPDAGIKIIQGYLVRSEKFTVRLRLADQQAFLTIKGSTHGISRSEYEYPIPLSDAMKMFQEFSDGNFITKTRYYTQVGQHRWEVDIFEGANTGLALAEIELSDENEFFEKPEWATSEVSFDRRYRNAALISHPYTQWVENTKNSDCEPENLP